MKKEKYIDHTLLKATAKKKEIIDLCNEAISYDFKSVCVNPCNVKLAKELLQFSNVLVCTVIGFPLGANTIDVKAFETLNSLNHGADEIDMVINIAEALDHNWNYIYEEIKQIKEICGTKILKVILETCYLSKEEIIEICQCAIKAKADFVKTSTGFGTGGATPDDVKLMRSVVGDMLGVKASGGIKTKEDFDKMIESGASRIGTSNGSKLL